MKAMILAAGLGTRLMPLTSNIPKCMMTINGKPLIEYQINWLKSQGIKDIAINLHHFPEKVMNYLGDGSRLGVRINYSIEKELLGTAGGVKKLKRFFGETFIVFYGDNYTDLSIEEVLKYHNSKKALITICLGKDLSEEYASNIIKLNKDNKIIAFIEKPSEEQVKLYGKNNTSNTGIYICEPELIDFIKKEKSDFGKDIFPELAGKESFYAYKMPESVIWYELGTLQRYYEYRAKIS